MTLRPWFSVLGLAAGAATAQTPSYTAADVALHATQADCWMILNTDKVYNVSQYLAIHPGGVSAMLRYCGKDGTAAFAGIGHSNNAVAQEANYFIGNLGTTTPVPVTISVALAPGSASVAVGGTLQFTPTVSNSTAGVAWTVTPASLGSISTSGLFTATSAGQGSVTATSTEDSSKSASASLTVNAPTTPPTGGSIGVSIRPSAVSLNTGSTYRFAARVSNSSQGVTWSVRGNIGSITTSGVFTAAATPGTGAVVATSVADSTISASSQATVTAASCTPAPRGRRDD